VDYSIHFIHRYRIEATRSSDLASTVQVTMETSGRAILLNAAAVAGGFSVLLFSSFMPVVYLGLLIPMIMATNALAALLIIPAFLNVLAGSRKRQTRAPGAFPAR
jgi:predicted RND superfamily exporter protein